MSKAGWDGKARPNKKCCLDLTRQIPHRKPNKRTTDKTEREEGITPWNERYANGV